MRYARLGQTGLLVSRLCFGAMTFRDRSEVLGVTARVGGGEADALVGRALDAGINFFDTADVYSEGESEAILGAALGLRRQDAVIATKCGLRTGRALTQGGLSRRHILWSIDQSLRRLGTDWIDIYVVHRQDPLTPLVETLQALDDIVRSGKVRYLAFSNWSAWRVSAALELQRAHGWAPFTHGQMSYSLLNRDIELDVIPMLTEYGLGLTAWSPLASGFLSGSYSRESVRDPSRRVGAHGGPGFDPEHGFAVVELLRTIAARREITIAQAALAWVLANPAVTSALLGANHVTQLEENLGAVDVELDVTELDELRTATPLPRIYPNWFHAWTADRVATKALRGKSRAAVDTR